MASLKDKSLCLLGQLTAQSVATGANPTLFTVPVGRVARIMQIVFRDPSASAAAAVNMSVNGFPGTMSLLNLITANTGFVVFEAAPAAGTPAAPTQGIEVASGVNVVLTITTGAAGVTCGIDVFGYLTT